MFPWTIKGYRADWMSVKCALCWKSFLNTESRSSKTRVCQHSQTAASSNLQTQHDRKAIKGKNRDVPSGSRCGEPVAEPYLRFNDLSDCRLMMLSGMVRMQLWYKFSVSKATRWQTSEGTSASRFFERSANRTKEHSESCGESTHRHELLLESGLQDPSPAKSPEHRHHVWAKPFPVYLDYKQKELKCSTGLQT